MPAQVSDQIPLDEWADSKNVPQRTANGWAKSGKIKARMQTALVTVTVTRKVRKYFVNKSEPLPQ